MARGYYESGYTRGGIDVTEAVNLVFKGLLLSPIFMLCIFVTIAMMKHMIFGGVPTMHQPTEQQREAIQERDANLDVAPVAPIDHKSALERVMEEPEVIPYTIYERKPDRPEEPATWNTEIEVDPFS
jgi:hypothetical protein